MKNLVFIFVLGLITFSFGAKAQIKVNSSGYVGINNTSPTYRLDVTGDVRFYDGNSNSIVFSGGYFNPSSYSLSLGSDGSMWGAIYADQAYFNYSPTILSDVNFKSNIKNLLPVTDKLKLLRPVNYKLNPYQGATTAPVQQADTTSQYGLIAQELQAVFPDMVTKQKNGTLGIRYMELIPVLIKALQEQQTELEALKERVAKLEDKK